MVTMVLLENQTGNGDGTKRTYPGGVGTLYIEGTWDGATVEIKAASQDGGTSELKTLLNGTFTDPYEPQNFRVGKNSLVRATLSNAGASTDISVRIEM